MMKNNEIDNSGRDHTMIFMYPGNGHTYIALKFQTFSNVVCSWICTVQDFRVLHTIIISGIFQKFTSLQMLGFVDQGKEERDGPEIFEKGSSSASACTDNHEAENSAEIGSFSLTNADSVDCNMREDW